MSETSAPVKVRSSAPLQRISLRRRLLHLIALASLLLTTSVGAAVTHFVYQTEQTAWQSRQHDSTFYSANTVGGFLQRVEDLLQVIGEIDRDYLEQHPDSLDHILTEDSILLEIIRLDSSAHLIAHTYRDAPVLSGLVSSPQPGWFLQALAGEDFTGPVQVSAGDQPYLILAKPGRDNSVVAARLQMSLLWEVVSGIHFGKTGSAYVIDQDGQIIAHPDPSVALTRTSIRNHPEMLAILAQPNLQWYGAYENFQGVPVVGAAAPIPGSQWIILTEASQDEVFASSRLAMLFLGGGMLLISILATLSTNFFLLRLIFNPIRRLQQGAKRLGEGNLDERIPVLQPDEIGQVTATFNEMADRLKDRETALAQARDQALETSRFKSRLLANVSHDLRTPLGGILGYADMLQKGVLGTLNDRQQTAAERIVANTGRLRSMINSLLDQAQIEAGTIKLRTVPFSPNSMINEVRMMIEVLAQSKCLTLNTEIDPDLPETLLGDPQRLQQILVNLAVNAIKFTNQGSVTIYLFSYDDCHWAIQVSDTGRGIPPEAQQLIFEPFRQVDSSSSLDQNGAGLGLSIVQQLAVLMGGHIQLSSQVGQGSMFTVILPFQERSEDEKIILPHY